MTVVRAERGQSAANRVAVHVAWDSFGRWMRPRRLAQIAAVAMLALGGAARTSALVISTGPQYVLPGGGSCSVSGVACQTGGAVVSCTGVNLSAHTKVYFGIRNDQFVIGNTMTGAGATPSSAAVFRYSSNTASSITYTSTTSIPDQVNGTQSVSNTLILTVVSGSASVVSTSGTPANNNNGDIEKLFQITAGPSFSVRVDLKAFDNFFPFGQACPSVFDPTVVAVGISDISGVDVGFYASDCGDGVFDSPEQCDEGGNNGSASSCCTSACQFRGAGETCRPGAGPPCDGNETCTGVAGTCPPDDATFNTGMVCRSGSGDLCDANETCTGVPGQGCPPDDAPGNITVACRAGSVGDICNVTEFCTGVPTLPCPPDDAPLKLNFICRAGSGDICDPEERCTGNPGQGCPSDVVSPPTTQCRAGGGDMCDPPEFCTAVPAQPCPANNVTPGGTQCRASAGQCDVAEQCTGTAGQLCPPNGFASASTPCDADSNVCTVDACNGSGSCVFQSNVDCEDGNVCTQDSCDPQDGCQSIGAPSTNCASPSKAILKIKDKSDNTKDGVKFLWRGGPSLVQDMGDPTTTTRYELCIYDSGGVRMAMGVPPGANWSLVGSPSSPKGYLYKDLTSSQDGIKLIKTKGSNLDKAKVKVVGKGTNLPDNAQLPFEGSVTAQLYASDGMCWEAQFGMGQTKKNSTLGYTGSTP